MELDLQPSLRRAELKFLSRYRWYERLFGTPAATWRGLWHEIQTDRDLLRSLVTKVREAGLTDRRRLGAAIQGPGLLGRLVTFGRFSPANAELYALIRERKPEVVVETGVASGVSSTLILTALSRNKKGRLYSIDKPTWSEGGSVDSEGKRDLVFTPKSLGSGWLVPEQLRGLWTLKEGLSRDLLPGLVASLGRVDFFFHDSEHSRTNMEFEYGVASKAIPPLGVLYSDDIFMNSAFSDFAKLHANEYRGGSSSTGRGILLKK